MNFERFYKLRRTLQAFNLKQIQETGIVLEWSIANGFSCDEVRNFSKMLPIVGQMEAIGYFLPSPGPEQGKAIRKFEQELPKEIRDMARKVRLQHAYTGRLRSG
jgi:hypothetical protein